MSLSGHKSILNTATRGLKERNVEVLHLREHFFSSVFKALYLESIRSHCDDYDKKVKGGTLISSAIFKRTNSTEAEGMEAKEMIAENAGKSE